MVKFTGRLWT